MNFQHIALASMSLPFFSSFLGESQRIGFANTSPKNTWTLRSIRNNEHDTISLGYSAVLLPGEEQWIDFSYLKEITGSQQEDFIYQVCDNTGNRAVLYINGDSPKCALYSGAKMNITVNPSGVTVQALPESIIASLSIVGENSLYNITAIPVSPLACDLAAPFNHSKRFIVHLDGGTEFEPRVPYPCDIQAYLQKGVNTIQLSFKWEYMQNFLGQNIPIDWSEGGYPYHFLSLIEAWKNYTIFFTMYDHMKYSYCSIGTPDCWVKNLRYANAWQDIAKNIANYSNVILSLMHEPNIYTELKSTEIVLHNQNIAAKSIRKSGFQKALLISGNSNSSLERWFDKKDNAKSNSDVFSSKNINDGNYALSVSSQCSLPETIRKRFSIWLDITNSKAYISDLVSSDLDKSTCLDELIRWALSDPNILGVDMTQLIHQMSVWDALKNLNERTELISEAAKNEISSPVSVFWLSAYGFAAMIILFVIAACHKPLSFCQSFSFFSKVDNKEYEEPMLTGFERVSID